MSMSPPSQATSPPNLDSVNSTNGSDRTNDIFAQPDLLVPWTTYTLCALCRVIARSPTTQRVNERLLKLSAVRGCALCRFFFEELVAHTIHLSQSQADMEISREGDNVSVIDRDDRRHRFEIYSVDPYGTPNNQVSQYRQIQPHPSYESCWTLIRSWLTTCESQHNPSCTANIDSWKPTRLIDVRTLRLVHGSDCHSESRYVTLSHCWGTRDFARTTLKLRSSFRLSLDLHHLPQSFQDAIFVTQKLGLQYLWIDALCIIQDDAEDWNREAQNMGLCYRHAYVNISALNSADAHGGFLHHREQRTSTDLGSGLRLRRARPSWNDIFRHAPLSKRAWVLQERLLSNRVIHFGKDELFWECSTTFAREGSFQQNSQQWEGGRSTEETFKRSLAFEGYLTENSTRNATLLMEQWDRIVCLYSTLELSKEGDKFPAIAGIAQKISEATGYTYLAGLWQEHLHSGLLWHVDAFTTRRYDSSRAPSWSWAALRSPVKMMFDTSTCPHPSKIEAEVVDTSVFLIDESEAFAHGESAEISIHAHHFQVWCRCSSDGFAPFSDPYLRMVLDIFDEGGKFIGTGYWDYLPDERVVQCTAMIVSQRVTTTYPPQVITYFLLVKNEGDYTKRIGIGSTEDKLHARCHSVMDAAQCVATNFLLR